MKNYIIGCILLLLLTGCNHFKTDNIKMGSEGKSMEGIALEEGAIERIENPLRGNWDMNERGETITFTNTHYKIDAGCNIISGEYSYKSDSGSITFNDGFMTQMGCSDDITTREQELLNIFKTFNAFQIEENTIQLSSTGESIILKKSLNTPLQGTTWKLSRILMDNGLVSDILFENSFLTFSEEGDLGGTAICNSMAAQYESFEDIIGIENIGLTKKICHGEEANTYEQALVKDLGKVTRVSIDRTTLTLEGEAGKVKLVYIAEL